MKLAFALAVGILTGAAARSGAVPPFPWFDPDRSFDDRVAMLVGNMTELELITQLVKVIKFSCHGTTHHDTPCTCTSGQQHHIRQRWSLASTPRQPPTPPHHCTPSAPHMCTHAQRWPSAQLRLGPMSRTRPLHCTVDHVGHCMALGPIPLAAIPGVCCDTVAHASWVRWSLPPLPSLSPCASVGSC
jgi:hypothetical protein